jgi:hypothetical protein
MISGFVDINYPHNLSQRRWYTKLGGVLVTHMRLTESDAWKPCRTRMGRQVRGGPVGMGYLQRELQEKDVALSTRGAACPRG